MKVVTLLSGGIDSVTLLHYLVKVVKADTIALSFNHGQRNKVELKYAIKACRKLSVPYEVMDISSIMQAIKKPQSQQKNSLDSKPSRNMIMLAIAVGYAASINYEYVAIAANADDSYNFPDCKKSFINAMRLASKLGTYNSVDIYTPFINLTKSQIVYLGKKLGINYDSETWSCYRGGRKHCGLCHACILRDTALRESVHVQASHIKEASHGKILI